MPKKKKSSANVSSTTSTTSTTATTPFIASLPPSSFPPNAIPMDEMTNLLSQLLSIPLVRSTSPEPAFMSMPLATTSAPMISPHLITTFLAANLSNLGTSVVPPSIRFSVSDADADDKAFRESIRDLAQGRLVKAKGKRSQDSIAYHFSILERHKTLQTFDKLLAHLGFYMLLIEPQLRPQYESHCRDMSFAPIDALKDRLDAIKKKGYKKKISDTDFNSLLMAIQNRYIKEINENRYIAHNDKGASHLQNAIIKSLINNEKRQAIKILSDEREDIVKYWMTHQIGQSLYKAYPITPYGWCESRCKDIVNHYEGQYKKYIELGLKGQSHNIPAFPFTNQIITLSTLICILMENNSSLEINGLAVAYREKLRLVVEEYKKTLGHKATYKNPALAYYYLIDALFIDHVNFVSGNETPEPYHGVTSLDALANYEFYSIPTLISSNYSKWKNAVTQVGILSEAPLEFCVESPLKNFSRKAMHLHLRREALEDGEPSPSVEMDIKHLEERFELLEKEEQDLVSRTIEAVDKYNSDLIGKINKALTPFNPKLIVNVFDELIKISREDNQVVLLILFDLQRAIIAYSFDDQLAFAQLCETFPILMERRVHQLPVLEEPIATSSISPEKKEEKKEKVSAKKMPFLQQSKGKKITTEEQIHRNNLLKEAREKLSDLDDEFLVDEPDDSKEEMRPTVRPVAISASKRTSSNFARKRGTNTTREPQIAYVPPSAPLVKVSNNESFISLTSYNTLITPVMNLLRKGFSPEEFFGNQLSIASQNEVLSFIKIFPQCSYEGIPCFEPFFTGSSIFNLMVRTCYPEASNFSPNDRDISSSCGDKIDELASKHGFAVSRAASFSMLSRQLKRSDNRDVLCEISITPKGYLPRADRHLPGAEKKAKKNAIYFARVTAVKRADSDEFYLIGLDRKILKDLAQRIFDLKRPEPEELAETYLILRTVKWYNYVVLGCKFTATNAVQSVLGQGPESLWLNQHLACMLNADSKRFFKEIARVIDWQKEYINRLKTSLTPKEYSLASRESVNTILPILNSFFITLLPNNESRKRNAEILTSYFSKLLLDEERAFPSLNLQTFQPLLWFKELLDMQGPKDRTLTLCVTAFLKGINGVCPSMYASRPHMFSRSSLRSSSSSSPSIVPSVNI